MKVANIDCDAMFYIVGSKYKDVVEETPDAIEEVQAVIFHMIETTCLVTGSDHHVLALSDPGRTYFRNSVYKYNDYKGGRQEDPDWLVRWRPHITAKLHEMGAVHKEELEADDILCYLAEKYTMMGIDFVTCSPDKDLRQIIGKHYDYSKPPLNEDGSIASDPYVTVDAKGAHYFLYQQVLMGDSSDNIGGIPGMGEVKAKKFLNAIDDPILYKSMVLQQYCKTFGPFYGPIIFRETEETVRLLNTLHPYFPEHQSKLLEINEVPFTGRRLKNADVLDQLGW